MWLALGKHEACLAAIPSPKEQHRPTALNFHFISDGKRTSETQICLGQESKFIIKSAFDHVTAGRHGANERTTETVAALAFVNSSETITSAFFQSSSANPSMLSAWPFRAIGSKIYAFSIHPLPQFMYI